jgi:hypothetical protein
MSFFYDLNKRLANLASKQDATQLAESKKAETVAQSPLTQALNEGMAKRLPGLPITKKDVEKKFGGSMIKMAQAAKEAGFSDARIRQAMDDLQQGKNPNDVAEADYSAKKAAAGKDIGKPGKNFGKIAKGAAERYGSKAAGERVAGAVLNKLRHPKESAGQEDTMDWLNDQLKDYDAQQTKTDESALQAYIGNKKYGKAGMDALRKAGRDGASKDKMSQIRNRYDKMDEADMEEGNEFSGELAQARASGAKQFKVDGKSYPVKEEGGMPMTPKQKSFAKLAPPVDKITFADKIAGAKKEVDEMLGDVAAEAIKSAVGKKKEPRSKGTAFDPEVAGQMFTKDPHPRHDVKDTGYSKRYTRKVQDEPQDDAEVSTEPKKKGRPKGPAKGPERVTAKSYKYKAGRPSKVAEDDLETTDRGEYDREGDMAKEQMHTIMSAAKELHSMLKDEENLPEWVQKKITLAQEYIDTARDYMVTQHAERAEEEPIAEKAVSKKQQKFMGMVHAAQKGEKPASGAVAKVAKDMPKKAAKDFASTKHKGLPEKVKAKKEESVEETADAPKEKKAKGGYDFGGGVYESMNARVEGMITEGMSVNISVDDQGKKSISVNATEGDAEALAQLLKMAGLGSGQQEKTCSGCGQSPCGCEEMVDENAPDWPTNTETIDADPNLRTYSGGLNGPKSTGQTTVPVVASQLRRQVSMEENVELERNLFKTWKNYKG